MIDIVCSDTLKLLRRGGGGGEYSKEALCARMQ